MATTTTNTTPTTSHTYLDAARALLCEIATGGSRWTIEGWAAHIRDARHARHVANSWAKHREEFEDQGAAVLSLTHTLTLAALRDWGLSTAEASALLNERVCARLERRMTAADATAH